MENLKLKDRLNSKMQIVEERNINMDKTAISSKSNYPALTNNALDIIRDNLKKQPLSFQLFDIVKSPSGGSTVFSVPGLSGDEAAKELTGIILDYSTPRAYWKTSDPVEGTPPDCFSEDSIISHDGKACATCPFNDFGSKDGDTNAKACKESVTLFLLRPDNIACSRIKQTEVSALYDATCWKNDPVIFGGYKNHSGEDYQQNGAAVFAVQF